MLEHTPQLLGIVSQLSLIALVSSYRYQGAFARSTLSLSAIFIAWGFAEAAYEATNEPIWHTLDWSFSPWVIPLTLIMVTRFVGRPLSTTTLAYILISAALSVFTALVLGGVLGVSETTFELIWSTLSLGQLLTACVLAFAMVFRYARDSPPEESVLAKRLLFAMALVALLGVLELTFAAFARKGAPSGVFAGSLASTVMALAMAYLGLRRDLFSPIRSSTATWWLPPLGYAVFHFIITAEPSPAAWATSGIALLGTTAFLIGRALMVRWQALQKRSERLSLIGRMTSQIAHDMVNPIASMTLAVEVLREEDPDNEMLLILEEQLSRLQVTSRRYLQFAATEKLERELTDVSSLFQKASTSATTAINFETPDETVFVDEGMMVGALTNLLANARDAMGDVSEPVRVGVTTQVHDVLLWVEDPGAGLSPRAFDVATQGEFSQKENGTGFGLWFVAKVVGLHGGSVESQQKEHGFRVTIRLPRSQDRNGP